MGAGEVAGTVICRCLANKPDGTEIHMPGDVREYMDQQKTWREKREMNKLAELEKKFKFLEADVKAIIAFLEEQANEKPENYPGAGRIVGSASYERKRMEEIAEYMNAKRIVTVYEEDNPEVLERRDI